MAAGCVQGGSPAAGKATDVCGSVPTPFPGLTACTETMKALSGPRQRSPCGVISTGTSSLSDLGTETLGPARKGVDQMPLTPQGEGNGRGKWLLFS